ALTLYGGRGRAISEWRHARCDACDSIRQVALLRTVTTAPAPICAENSPSHQQSGMNLRSRGRSPDCFGWIVGHSYRGWRSRCGQPQLGKPRTSGASSVRSSLQRFGDKPSRWISKRCAITDSAVVAIAATQHPDGSWDSGLAQHRPPISQSTFGATAKAIGALQHYSFPARKQEFAQAIERARVWLTSGKPVTTEDYAMRLY